MDFRLTYNYNDCGLKCYRLTELGMTKIFSDETFYTQSQIMVEKVPEF